VQLLNLTKEILFSNNPSIFLDEPERREEILTSFRRSLFNYSANIEDINRAAFLAMSSIYRDPFSSQPCNDDHPIIKEFIFLYAEVVTRILQEKHAEALSTLPSLQEFESWCLEVVQKDESNEQNPLFGFLQSQADLEQLKEYCLQESPFDMFFSDLINSMQSGHYDSEREEMLENLWDEMGHGSRDKFHRNMRIHMMKAFDIPLTYHLDEIEYFDVSQLILANYYLLCAHSRRGMPILVGMMLATECMVPGRLEKQIAGWLRCGADKNQIDYLIEHVHVDAEHAKGWMNNVVLPLVKKNPAIIEPLALGIFFRLTAATDVCHAMYKHLQR